MTSAWGEYFIMDPSQISSRQQKSSTSWLSILQLALSALAAFLLLNAAGIIAVVNLTKFLTQGSSASDPTQPLMIATSLAFAGFLTLPSAWYAGKRIANPGIEPAPWREPRRFGLTLTIIVIVTVIVALLIGDWVSKDTRISWLLLPPLNIIATGLPALWLVYIGTQGLIPGAPSRKWGVFTSGLVLGPLTILILEFIALIGMGILALLWIMLDSQLANQLNSLAFRIQSAGANPEALLRIISPFLLNPGVLFTVFAFISVIVPLIEEALKPIGVWFLAGQKITPAQGFGFGVLSGAGFGLFENLGNTSGGGETWALLVSARISTLLLHCLTAGLIGWALASAWSQRRYLRLGVTYILAVILHGIWNGMAVLSFVSTLESQANINIPASLQNIGSLSSIGIVALGGFNLAFFIGFNSILRRNLHKTVSAPSANVPEIDEHPQPLTPISNPAPIPPSGDTSLPGTDWLNTSEEENPPENLESK